DQVARRSRYETVQTKDTVFIRAHSEHFRSRGNAADATGFDLDARQASTLRAHHTHPRQMPANAPLGVQARTVGVVRVETQTAHDDGCVRRRRLEREISDQSSSALRVEAKVEFAGHVGGADRNWVDDVDSTGAAEGGLNARNTQARCAIHDATE